MEINPIQERAFALPEALALDGQAFELGRAGDLQGAERLHLQALEMKEQSLPPSHTSTAITLNALGELYLKRVA